ncbi:MAG: 30S ribosomal protein S16 [bacterium]
MAVRIRLTRLGRKKRPFYRIVVTDSRAPRDGRYKECIGTYNPIMDPPEIQIQEERANYWLDRGAVPSDTVNNLLQHQGVMIKRFLTKRGFDESRIDEEMKKWEVLQIERRRREAEKTESKKKEKAEAKKIDDKVEVVPEEKAEAADTEMKGEEAEVLSEAKDEKMVAVESGAEEQADQNESEGSRNEVVDEQPKIDESSDHVEEVKEEKEE